MSIQTFRSQSPYWDWARVIFDGVDPSSGEVTGVRLQKRTSGVLREYRVLPGGQWSGKQINFPGEVTVHTPPVELALGKAGRGGYSGWVFGKLGAVVELDQKGAKAYIIFGPDGPIASRSLPE